MPKASQSKKSGRTSSGKDVSESFSQPSQEQTGKSQRVIENLDEHVNNCVRYVIYRVGNNLPIRRTELQKTVLMNVGRQFDAIMKKATEILKDVYGYDIYLSGETSSTKVYLVSNALPYKQGLLDDGAVPKDANKIIIMLVLTHIFMCNRPVSQDSISSFLNSLDIKFDERHELFGNVKDFVTVTMVKQKYLSANADQVTSRINYTWGPKSEHEISKHELLKFVCKIYKDCSPATWTDQFEKANQQFKVLQQDEAMEIEEETN